MQPLIVTISAPLGQLSQSVARRRPAHSQEAAACIGAEVPGDLGRGGSRSRPGAPTVLICIKWGLRRQAFYSQILFMAAIEAVANKVGSHAGTLRSCLSELRAIDRTIV
jgi:hypothetical protein